MVKGIGKLTHDQQNKLISVLIDKSKGDHDLVRSLENSLDLFKGATKGTLDTLALGIGQLGGGGTLSMKLNQAMAVFAKPMYKYSADQIQATEAFRGETMETIEQLRRISRRLDINHGRLTKAQKDMRKTDAKDRHAAWKDSVKTQVRDMGVYISTSGKRVAASNAEALLKMTPEELKAYEREHEIGDSMLHLQNAQGSISVASKKELDMQTKLAQDVARNTTDLNVLIKQGVQWFLTKIYELLQTIAGFFDTGGLSDEEKAAKSAARAQASASVRTEQATMERLAEEIARLEETQRYGTKEEKEAVKKQIESKKTDLRKSRGRRDVAAAISTAIVEDVKGEKIIGPLDDPMTKERTKESFLGQAQLHPAVVQATRQATSDVLGRKGAIALSHDAQRAGRQAAAEQMGAESPKQALSRVRRRSSDAGQFGAVSGMMGIPGGGFKPSDDPSLDVGKVKGAMTMAGVMAETRASFAALGLESHAGAAPMRDVHHQLRGVAEAGKTVDTGIATEKKVDKVTGDTTEVVKEVSKEEKALNEAQLAEQKKLNLKEAERALNAMREARGLGKKQISAIVEAGPKATAIEIEKAKKREQVAQVVGALGRAGLYSEASPQFQFGEIKRLAERFAGGKLTGFDKARLQKKMPGTDLTVAQWLQQNSGGAFKGRAGMTLGRAARAKPGAKDFLYHVGQGGEIKMAQRIDTADDVTVAAHKAGGPLRGAGGRGTTVNHVYGSMSSHLSAHETIRKTLMGRT
jgi:hypothetical protein